jgi:hypothetical protein
VRTKSVLSKLLRLGKSIVMEDFELVGELDRLKLVVCVRPPKEGDPALRALRCASSLVQPTVAGNAVSGTLFSRSPPASSSPRHRGSTASSTDRPSPWCPGPPRQLVQP